MRDHQDLAVKALAWGIFWMLLVGLVWWAACGPEISRGEAWYDSGDTLSVHMAALDSSGAVFLPDSTRIIFVRNGTRKDSIGYNCGTYGGTWTSNTVLTAKGGGWLSGIFVIPSSWNPPYDLVLEGRFWGDGYTEDVALVEPRRVRVLDTVPYVTELVEAFNDSIGYVTEVGTTYLLDEAFPTTMAVTGGYVDSVGVAVLLREDWPTSIDSVGFVTTTQTAVELTEAFPTSMTTTGGYLDSVGVAVLLREEWPTQIDSVGIALLVDEPFAVTGGWIDSVLVAVELREEIAGGAGGNPTGGYIDSVGVAILLREDWPTKIDSVDYVVDLIETLTVGNIDSVRAIGYVDSISTQGAADIFRGLANELAASVDTFDCTPCGFEINGYKVSDGMVFISSDSVSVSNQYIRGFTPFVSEGYWTTTVRLTPGQADTLWVRFARQNAFVGGATRLIVP